MDGVESTNMGGDKGHTDCNSIGAIAEPVVVVEGAEEAVGEAAGPLGVHFVGHYRMQLVSPTMGIRHRIGDRKGQALIRCGNRTGGERE